MARIPRSQLISATEPGTFHVFSRLVRRSFLMGHDDVTGKDYDQRRDWVVSQVKILSKVFLIDVLAVGVMQNHLHEILRSRPDLAANLSDHEVSLRWCLLNEQGIQLNVPEGERSPKQRKRLRRKIDALLKDRKKLSKAREALSSISVYEKRLKYTIARNANCEDSVTGPFFAGRFESIPIVTATQLLTTMVYVDLNPIRAGLAETPETSRYTSAYERIRGVTARLHLSGRTPDPSTLPTSEAQLTPEQQASIRELTEHPDVQALVDAWLSPIDERREGIVSSQLDCLETSIPEKDESPAGIETTVSDQPMVAKETDSTVSQPSQQCVSFANLRCPKNQSSTAALAMQIESEDPDADLPYLRDLPCRASNKGCLPITTCDYLKILDWTGQQLRDDKKGKIPDHLPPILERLRIRDFELWFDGVQDYFSRMKRFFTKPANQLIEASRCLIDTLTGQRAVPDALL